MYIKNLKIHKFRAFQNFPKDFSIDFSRHLTAIAGMNGVGKSTILAILSNSSELKTKYGKLLDNSQFRGDFAKIIYYDPYHDKSGHKAKITFSKNINGKTNIVNFRATKQNHTRYHTTFTKVGNNLYKKVHKSFKQKRYRLIPEQDSKGWDSTAKVNWPVAYLGLSRIYPVGESNNASVSSVPSSISKKIVNVHSNLMDENIDDNESSFENIKLGGMRKRKAGIDTGKYSATSNSSGQDDLGKIILTVLSFANLKKHLKDKYNGGLIAIDEIDVTLHPAVQKSLLKWLYKESRKLELQIVFTTHSYLFLKYMYKMIHNPKDFDKGSLKIDYLRRVEPDEIDCEEDLPPQTFLLDLQNEYKYPHKINNHVVILTEDSITRLFLKSILAFYKKDVSNKSDFVRCKLSWANLASLAMANDNNMSNFIYVVDPDLNSCSESEAFNDLNRMIIKRFGYNGMKINDSSGNFFILPGNACIEKMIRKFSLSLDFNKDSAFFNNKKIKPTNITPMMLRKHGPNFKKYKNSNQAYKNWFKDNRNLCKDLIRYWICKHDVLVKKFALNIYGAICRKYYDMLK